MYHNKFNSDQITDIFNNLIRITEQDKCGELLQGLVMTKPMGSNYELVFTIRNEYRNPDIMIEAIFETTEKLLEWFDITEFCNFNILIHINDYSQKYFKMSYFELFQRMSKKGLTFTLKNNVIVTHPRYERFMRWANEEKRREQYEKQRCELEQAKQARMLSGGKDLFNQSDLVLPVNKPEKKSWVRKIKEKILSL